MKKRNLFVSFLVGFIFALGLGISGMTQPQKVIGFLDLFGTWDPSLMFVMVGAIAVHSLAYRYIKNKNSPFFADTFQVPSNKQIDKKLMIGSGLFGIGWGLGGYCPGPGITSMASLGPGAFVFVGAMLLGMLVYRAVGRKLLD